MASPALTLSLTADVSEGRLAALTRDLLRDLARVGVAAEAPPVPSPAPGERGDLGLLGQIIVLTIGSGVPLALAQCLKAYIAREKSLRITIKMPDGKEMVVDTGNLPTPEAFPHQSPGSADNSAVT